MPEPSQHFYHSQRIKLSYWEWGDSSAPPLVLIHGRRDHARAWDRVAEAFADRYRVIAADMRGHGDSDWSSGSHYTPTEIIGDIARLMDVVVGRPAPVICHSFFGGHVLLTAGILPDRFERIASIEAANPRPWGEKEPGPAQLSEWISYTRTLEDRQEGRTFPSVDAAAAYMRERNPRLTPEVSQHLALWGTRPAAGEGITWKFDPWLLSQPGLEIRADEIPHYWANITCPVLHIVGGESPPQRAMYMGKRIDTYFRDSRIARVEGAGHWVHHERFEPTLDVLREFLGADKG